MAQSLANILIHLVFSTKQREPMLHHLPPESLHAYLGGILSELTCTPLAINSVADHVHLLFRLGKTQAPSLVIERVKSGSSAWLKRQADALDSFAWQRGYGAFGISQSHSDAVITYIRNQQEHHRTENFQDEFRRLCRKNDAPLDERYAWD